MLNTVESANRSYCRIMSAYLLVILGVACTAFAALLAGCGATGVNKLPADETSVYAGRYVGEYTGYAGETGTFVLSVANNASMFGTITTPTKQADGTIKQRSGPLAGTVRQDGKFKAFYHYADDTATQYQGGGQLTAPGTTVTGTLTVTAPVADALNITLTKQP